jgi:predicted Zn-dependent peptidase
LTRQEVILGNNQASSKYLIDRIDYVTKQLIQALLVQILQANQAWVEDLIGLIL